MKALYYLAWAVSYIGAYAVLFFIASNLGMGIQSNTLLLFGALAAAVANVLTKGKKP